MSITEKMNLKNDLSELPLETWNVYYDCPRHSTPIVRTVEETDVINAIIEARREERRLTGVHCPDCKLKSVLLAD